VAVISVVKTMNNDAAAIWLVAPENQVGRTRKTPESILSARAI
jgi:hypothetical protein